MGGSRSAKRKSLKRKSSKASAETRRKKINRRTKSRKLRNSDGSSSYSDDSSCSVSISSSSSEDGYRRARSRTRSEVRDRRKRNRRSSSSSDSSEDSRHAKKSKGSKRSSKNFKPKKKSQKKKRRREPSVSSDSRSCSTCRDGSSDREDSEFEKPRGRSIEKRKKKRDSVKTKSRTKRNKNRSSSCSSFSRSSGGSGPTCKDILPVDYSSRRLRSVITIAKAQENEEYEQDKDGHKEEILYDHDDYPSSRSNDSNEGGSKRELAHHLCVDSKRTENAKGGALVTDFKQSELTKRGVKSGGQDYESNSLPDGVEAANSYKKNQEVFRTSSSSNSEDLESMLRLKALENLKKYRGGLLANAKPPAEKYKNDGDVEQLSPAKYEFVQHQTPKDRILGATSVLDQNLRLTSGTDSAHHPSTYGKVDEGKGSVAETGSPGHSNVFPPNQGTISGDSREGNSPAGADTNKSELGKSSLKQESSGTTFMMYTQGENVLASASNVNTSSVETFKNVGQKSSNNDIEINKVKYCESSSLKSTLVEHSPKEQQGEEKEGSQFEQKTMSVMRGGEMVQVSYKVYIPKKAPALARRQLRR